MKKQSPMKITHLLPNYDQLQDQNDKYTLSNKIPSFQITYTNNTLPPHKITKLRQYLGVQKIKKIQEQLKTKSSPIIQKKPNSQTFIDSFSQTNVSQLQSQISTLEQHLRIKQMQNNSLIQQNQILSTKINELEQRINLSQQNLKNTKYSMNKIISQKDIQIDNLQIQLKQAQNKISYNLKQTMHNQSQKYAQLQSMFSELQTKLNQNLHDLDKCHQKVQELQKQNDELVHSLKDTQQKSSFYEQKYLLLSQQNERLRIENLELKQKLEENSRKQQNQRDFAKINTELQQSKTEIVKLQQALRQLRQKFRIKEAQHDQFYAIFNSKDELIYMYESQIEGLKNQIAKYKDNKVVQDSKLTEATKYQPENSSTNVSQQSSLEVLQIENNHYKQKIQTLQQKITQWEDNVITFFVFLVLFGLIIF